MAKKKAKAKNIVPTTPVVYKVIAIGYACDDHEYFFIRKPVKEDIINILKKVGSYDLADLLAGDITIKDVADIRKVKIEN